MTSVIPNQNRPREFAIVLILAVVQLSHILDFVLLMPLGPQLMRALTIDVEKFSQLVAVYTLSAALSCFLASFIMDRLDRRSLLLFIYGGLILGTFGCGLAPSFSLLLGARIITGIFGGLLQAIILSILADVIPLERRGRATGMVMGAFAVSSVAGVPLGLAIANRFGWNMPFLALGCVSLGNWGLVWLKIPPIRDHIATRAHDDRLGDSVSIFRNANTAVSVLLIVSMMTVFAMFPFVSPFLVNIVGIQEQDLPQIYLVGGLASLVATPLIGFMSDKFGSRQVFVGCTALSMVAVFFFSRLQASTLAVALTLNALVGAVGVGRMTPSMNLISRSVSSRQRGSFMGLIAAVQQLAASAASYAGGLILGGSAGMQNFSLIGAIVAISMLVSIGLCFLFRPVQEQVCAV